MTNPMTPTEQDNELREKLAAIEHQRWADWQRRVHSVCYENKGVGGEPTGELTIPSELARHWERQIETPYHELSEKEKNSDKQTYTNDAQQSSAKSVEYLQPATAKLQGGK